jgi:hypothetical protein
MTMTRRTKGAYLVPLRGGVGDVAFCEPGAGEIGGGRSEPESALQS